jgi:hypothetical protein
MSASNKTMQKLKNGIQLKFQIGMQLLKTSMIIWKQIWLGNTKTSATESLGNELKQHKPWFDEKCSKLLN